MQEFSARVGAGRIDGDVPWRFVGKDIAINFSLAAGLLVASSAGVAALCGTVLSIETLALARRRPLPRPVTLS
jgi:hypothetical protein